MRLLIIVYDSGIEIDLVELTKELDLPGWTKVFGAHGHGATGTKLGDPIWPGTNNVLYVAVPDEQVAPVLAALDELKGSFRTNPGITPFVVPLDEVSAPAANNPEGEASNAETEEST